MRKILTLLIVLLLSEIGAAQSDVPSDAVRFENWGVYLPCPPCSGIATVPIFTYNFEYLVSMEFHLKWTGPVEICTVKFSSEIDEYFEDQLISIDTANNVIAWEITNIVPPYLRPGFRNIGYMVISIYDTGTATIDTNRPQGDPNPPILFVDEGGFFISPTFYSPPVHLTEQDIKPGDANGDMLISLVDIIYFVNYIFKYGSEPVNKQMSDVNLDCALNIQDLIFLVNFVFKSGPKPLPSWCGDQPLPCPDGAENYVDLGANWSPDGNSLAFYHVSVSMVDSFGLYIFDTVNSMAWYLSGAGRLAEYPDWSPVGDWVVFEKYGQVFKIKATGDSLTQLTFSGENFFPEWSPDGSKIVYDRIDSVWIMDADGSNKRGITGGRLPSFSPDGLKILYVGYLAEGPQIFMADTSGSGAIQLTSLSGGGDTRHPSFSPGGDKIVFEHQLPGERPDTWVMNSDGTNVTRLTTDGGYTPSWSPDGSKILYTNSCQYNGYLWIMNPDGSDKRQITFKSLYK